ncbi:MAG: KamA family radical SAM protein [Smithellaceae bacterium]
MMNKKYLSAYFPNMSRRNWQDWRWQFQNRVTSVNRLAEILPRTILTGKELRRVVSRYPLAITPYYLSLMTSADKQDAIALQCLPDTKEISAMPDYLADPLNEDGQMPAPKLIHRYPDRALAMVTQVCATYCRHCNRKRFWTTPNAGSLKHRIGKMVRYIETSPQIREVILSGGDPLTYDDDQLEFILSSFAAIPHVEVLRIGSRIPVVLPMRITKELCRILKRYRPVWFNTQFNHPQEITLEATRACNRLQEAGIPVSNQSVLLKGVNDSVGVMRELLHGLQKISIRPYYLFHCEPVRGCSHFRSDLQSGLTMMEYLRLSSSGLALPQYVADLPGSAGKTPILALSQTIKKNFEKHQDFFDNFQ